VPLRYWRERSEGEAADTWLQPLVPLETDVTYTLAFTGLGVMQALRAVAQPSEAPLRRLFPPPGSEKHRISVLCDVPDDALPHSFALSPGDSSVEIASGVAGLPGAGCATLSLRGELAEPAVAPPVLAGFALEPSAWLPTRPKAAGGCERGELFLGACLQIFDDRLVITPEGDDELWVLDRPEPVTVAAREGAATVLLRDLLPDTLVTLRGVVVSNAGAPEPFERSALTARARRHVVLSEVLANPNGPEPASEWIEIVNDSARPASLAGLWLEDSGGHAALPAAELAPGELALLVPAGFLASAADVPLPEGVRLLELSSLGARGLSNGGESLLLVGAEGVVSRFPALAAPHPGRSIARRSLDGADDDPANFAEHGAPGASPGFENSFDTNVE
jgi:hypothetical protein